MKKYLKLFSIILVVAALVCTSAFAAVTGTGSSTKNGIYLQIGASGVSWEATTYVLCNSATFVSTTVTVYSASGLPISTNTDSGVVEAFATATANKADCTAIGTCYATINGTNKTGPTLTTYFS